MSLNDSIDTTTTNGALVFRVFVGFDRELIKERSATGIALAQKLGQKISHPKGLSKETEKKSYLAKSLYRENKHSIQSIAMKLCISKTTLYKYLRYRGIDITALPL